MSGLSISTIGADVTIKHDKAKQSIQEIIAELMKLPAAADLSASHLEKLVTRFDSGLTSISGKFSSGMLTPNMLSKLEVAVNYYEALMLRMVSSSASTSADISRIEEALVSRTIATQNLLNAARQDVPQSRPLGTHQTPPPSPSATHPASIAPSTINRNPLQRATQDYTPRMGDLSGQINTAYNDEFQDEIQQRISQEETLRRQSWINNVNQRRGQQDLRGSGPNTAEWVRGSPNPSTTPLPPETHFQQAPWSRAIEEQMRASPRREEEEEIQQRETRRSSAREAGRAASAERYVQSARNHSYEEQRQETVRRKDDIAVQREEDADRRFQDRRNREEVERRVRRDNLTNGPSQSTRSYANSLAPRPPESADSIEMIKIEEGMRARDRETRHKVQEEDNRRISSTVGLNFQSDFASQLRVDMLERGDTTQQQQRHEAERRLQRQTQLNRDNSEEGERVKNRNLAVKELRRHESRSPLEQQSLEIDDLAEATSQERDRIRVEKLASDQRSIGTRGHSGTSWDGDDVTLLSQETLNRRAQTVRGQELRARAEAHSLQDGHDEQDARTMRPATHQEAGARRRSRGADVLDVEVAEIQRVRLGLRQVINALDGARTDQQRAAILRQALADGFIDQTRAAIPRGSRSSRDPISDMLSRESYELRQRQDRLRDQALTETNLEALHRRDTQERWDASRARARAAQETEAERPQLEADQRHEKGRTRRDTAWQQQESTRLQAERDAEAQIEVDRRRQIAANGNIGNQLGVSQAEYRMRQRTAQTVTPIQTARLTPIAYEHMSPWDQQATLQASGLTERQFQSRQARQFTQLTPEEQTQERRRQASLQQQGTNATSAHEADMSAAAKRGEGSTTRSFRFLAQQGAYAFDDAISSYPFGGMKAALRGAGNNITAMLATTITNPVVAGLSVIGASLAIAIIPKLMEMADAASLSTEEIKKFEDSIDSLRTKMSGDLKVKLVLESFDHHEIKKEFRKVQDEGRKHKTEAVDPTREMLSLEAEDAENARRRQVGYRKHSELYNGGFTNSDWMDLEASTPEGKEKIEIRNYWDRIGQWSYKTQQELFNLDYEASDEQYDRETREDKALAKKRLYEDESTPEGKKYLEDRRKSHEYQRQEGILEESQKYAVDRSKDTINFDRMSRISDSDSDRSYQRRFNSFATSLTDRPENVNRAGLESNWAYEKVKQTDKRDTQRKAFVEREEKLKQEGLAAHQDPQALQRAMDDRVEKFDAGWISKLDKFDEDWRNFIDKRVDEAAKAIRDKADRKYDKVRGEDFSDYIDSIDTKSRTLNADVAKKNMEERDAFIAREEIARLANPNVAAGQAHFDKRIEAFDEQWDDFMRKRLDDHLLSYDVKKLMRKPFEERRDKARFTGNLAQEAAAEAELLRVNNPNLKMSRQEQDKRKEDDGFLVGLKQSLLQAVDPKRVSQEAFQERNKKIAESLLPDAEKLDLTALSIRERQQELKKREAKMNPINQAIIAGSSQDFDLKRQLMTNEVSPEVAELRALLAATNASRDKLGIIADNTKKQAVVFKIP